MDNSYISAPQQFEHMEGNSIDFKKTFDLNGTSNDDMLRLYLRKAGLSDEIECLSPEQRRAFIYDIIKSNKMPGYWMPSTMKSVSPHSQQQQAKTRAAPPPPTRQEANSILAEQRIEPTTPTLNYATMRISSSTGSLQSMTKSSPLMPHRFAHSKNIPSSPTTVVRKNGIKYEISGPINFTHVSGDMTRDMTKKAFDLTLTMNDNVLKKYLIERGIKDEEIAGISKQDLIRKIVQSRYTWMPPGHNEVPTNESEFPVRNTQRETLPMLRLTSSSSSSFSSSSPSTPQPTAFETFEEETNGSLSNFALVTSRFADPSQFPSPNSLFSQTNESESEILLRTQAPPQKMRPAPPPRKPKSQAENVSVPPPPSFITATPSNINTYHANLEQETEKETITEVQFNQMSRNAEDQSEVSTYEIYSQSKTGAETVEDSRNFAGVPPPPPPPPPLPSADGFTSRTATPIYAQVNNRNGETPLTLIPPPLMSQSLDPREDFLSSIRQGVTLKKVEKKGFTVGGFRPRSKVSSNNFRPLAPTPTKKPVSAIPSPQSSTPPMPKTIINNTMQSALNKRSTLTPPPPPPPPMPKISINTPNNGSTTMPPPPPPMPKISINTPNNGSTTMLPPPPPPPPPPQLNEQVIATAAISATANTKAVTTAPSGDSRDALLESIRNGVALKKMNKKGATISGTKPRAESKPPVTDFLSELKMGITLRRVKNSNDNLYADGPDESEA